MHMGISLSNTQIEALEFLSIHGRVCYFNDRTIVLLSSLIKSFPPLTSWT